MTNEKTNLSKSSKSSEKLRLDFYESGNGETIIITFPSGSIGVVDAHPSSSNSRPDILSLTKNKELLFVCLTHPHADHGIDLIPLLESHPNVRSFWYTNSSVDAFMFWTTEITNYPSAVQTFARDISKGWANFLTDLYSAAINRGDSLEWRLLQSNQESWAIDDVAIHCLGPDEAMRNKFDSTYRRRAKGDPAKLPNPNILSAILALQFGDAVVVLGADALKDNWTSALAQYHKRGLPKALLLKVPHHGARNAMNWKGSSYLDLCSRTPIAKSVLFAGDSDHPDSEVYNKIRDRTDPLCLSNGLLRRGVSQNPLAIDLPGARAEVASPICNPAISVEIGRDAKITVVQGNNCTICPITTSA